MGLPCPHPETKEVHMNAYVVSYKGAMFLWYRTVNGRARLLNANGTKFPGTPAVVNVAHWVVKTIPALEFNRNWYVSTKQGVFSCSTGHKVIDTNIISMFKEVS
jgi:hypothetical protein